VDAYVICSDCLAELDREACDDERHLPSFEGAVETALSPSETEARLRKLLDDW
jgi:hypothetical protein